MIVKDGFLLIELLISFTLTLFFIFITTHYIVEIKKIQHAALFRMEVVSYARNCAEKMIAGKSMAHEEVHADGFTIQQHLMPTPEKDIFTLKAINVKKKDPHYHCSTTLFVCTPHLNNKQTG